jgi:hypothetical protein
MRDSKEVSKHFVFHLKEGEYGGNLARVQCLARCHAQMSQVGAGIAKRHSTVHAHVLKWPESEIT